MLGGLTEEIYFKAKEMMNLSYDSQYVVHESNSMCKKDNRCMCYTKPE